MSRFCKDNEFAANPQELIDLGELSKNLVVDLIDRTLWIS
jgi:hypothetical protein